MAKDFVKTGVRWCVGTGDSIDVLNSPWLPDPENPFVITSHPSLEGAKVSQLMSVSERAWDLELVKDIFQERDVGLILGIPLSAGQDADRLCWSHEVSGVYSVRSAYQLIQRNNGRWATPDSGQI